MDGGARASPAFAPCSPPTHTPRVVWPCSSCSHSLRPRPYSSSIGMRPPTLRSCCPLSSFAPPSLPPVRTARLASSTPTHPCSDTETTSSAGRRAASPATWQSSVPALKNCPQFPSSKNHHSPLQSSFQSGLD
ncbi:hypothetical protein PVAP13_8KG323706 [Panicum virgatum]|uniref:Uncharacterized protein n=1 Tax=Panicum virgatum TaxID=38727 RepID=A0A8T0PNJ0_PANVG|nr:hypothetical protein PVAP13_8KG323706 [Panicum virgatum]